MRRVVVALGVVIVALIPIGFLIVLLGPDSSPTERLVAGFVILVVVVPVVYGVQVRRAAHRPMRPRSTTLDGRPATFVPQGPHALRLILLVVADVLIVCLVVTVADRSAGLVFLVVLGLPLLSLVPDVVRALRSGPGLVMSETLVELRALDRVTRFGWDDVQDVRLGFSRYGLVLVFEVDESAPTFSTHSTRLVWRLGPRPEDRRYTLPTDQLGDDPSGLALLVRASWSEPERRRRFAEPW